MTMDELLEHADWAGALARRLVRDQAQADDLVQEAWAVALARRGQPVRAPRAFLATVMSRLVGRESRREVARFQAERAVARRGRDLAEQSDAKFQALKLLLGAMEDLPHHYRAVLVQHYFEGLLAREIGLRSGISAAAVRTRLKRGRDLLRAQLDRRDEGPGQSWCLALIPLALEAEAARVGLGMVLGKGAMAMSGKVKLAGALLLVVAVGLGSYLASLPPGREPLGAGTPDLPRTEVGDSTEGLAPGAGTAAKEAAVGMVAPATEIEVPRPVVTQAEAGLSLEGIVVDDRGLPVAEAVARLWNRTDGSLIKAVRTGDDGRFRLGGIPGGLGMIFEALCNNVGRHRRDLDLETDRDLGQILLEGEGRLAGVLRDRSGSARAGVMLELLLQSIPADREIQSGLETAWVETDSEGRFSTRGLRPGRYSISISQNAELLEGETLFTTGDLEIVLTIISSRLTLRAIGADGVALEGVTFRLIRFAPGTDLDQARYADSESMEDAGDDDAQVEFELAPDEPCIVAAAHETAFAEVLVPPAGSLLERRIDLVLRPLRPGARLRIDARSPAGERPAKLIVSLRSPRGEIEVQPWMGLETDSSGVLADLPVGRFIVEIEYPKGPWGEGGLEQRMIQLEEGAEALIDLLLPPAAKLGLRIDAPESFDLREIHLELHRLTGNEITHVFRFVVEGAGEEQAAVSGVDLLVPGDLPPGAYRLVLVRRNQALIEQEVLLAPGARQIVNLILR